MTEDERQIRALIETWQAAGRAGDLETILDLMTDDAVFMVPGIEPFGKAAYAEAYRAFSDLRMEVRSDIREIEIHGERAYVRCFIKVRATPIAGGETVQRSGYTMTIFRKADGRWRLARDANLIAADKD